MIEKSGETVEQILTGIAEELRPDFDKAVAELGDDQVRQNIENGLARMAAARAEREANCPHERSQRGSYCRKCGAAMIDVAAEGK